MFCFALFLTMKLYKCINSSFICYDVLYMCAKRNFIIPHTCLYLPLETIRQTKIPRCCYIRHVELYSFSGFDEVNLLYTSV